MEPIIKVANLIPTTLYTGFIDWTMVWLKFLYISCKVNKSFTHTSPRSTHCCRKLHNIFVVLRTTNPVKAYYSIILDTYIHQRLDLHTPPFSDHMQSPLHQLAPFPCGQSAQVRAKWPPQFVPLSFAHE